MHPVNWENGGGRSPASLLESATGQDRAPSCGRVLETPPRKTIYGRRTLATYLWLSILTRISNISAPCEARQIGPALT